MTDEEVREIATADILRYMLRVAEVLKDLFPHHSTALRGEIIGTRFTSERWHRVANVLSSLNALPGAFMSSAERDSRLVGLQASGVAREMGYAMFGAQDPRAKFEFVSWWTADLSSRMAKQDEQPTSTHLLSSSTNQGV